MILRSILIQALLISLSSASYCGQAAIPFTFQVLRNRNQPVLGCARPRCFGWNENGTRAGDTAQFYRINGKEDGYLRRSDQLLRARSKHKDSDFIAQTARCENTYRTSSCSNGEWVGGLAPQSNLPNNPFQIRCCFYSPLLKSEDRGVATVKPGQLVVGGEVTFANRLIAFDYISDIERIIMENGTTHYLVYIRRMTCSDNDDSSFEEQIVSRNAVMKNLDGDVKMNQEHAALQTPVNVAAAPLFQHQHVLQSNELNPYEGQSSSYQYQHTNQQTAQQIPDQITNTLFHPMNPFMNVPYKPIPNYSQQVLGSQPPGIIGGETFQRTQADLTPNVPTQTYSHNNLSPVSNPTSQTPPPIPMSTLPPPTPLTFPSLDKLPRIDIPSIEDVENSIPPVQRAILTSVARALLPWVV